MTRMEADPRRLLVLEEARRAVDQQVRDLDGLRSRASALVVLTVGIGTFLSGLIVNRTLATSCTEWTGFAALAVSVLLGLNALRPQSFTFSLDVTALDRRSHDDEIDDLVRNTAFGLQGAARSNQAVLNSMFQQYVWALGFVVLGTALVIGGLVW